ncbi:MAG: hypothetical protein QM773_02705 [Hyphomonadaceae bacterium]
MAQTGFERPQTGSSELPPKVSAERARQGQNIKGMVWVLLISIGLVVAAYMVMLALQQKPVTPDNKPAEATAPATPETAQSPPA